MKIFADTSALYALIQAADKAHESAAETWARIKGSPLVTSSYVLVETCALLQARIGIQAVRDFHDDMLPILDVVWIDRELHDLAKDRLLDENLRDLSLVDCSSFVVMDRLGISTAFAFDAHFTKRGFEQP
jgi:predicted nucleic acid-binding protein